MSIDLKYENSHAESGDSGSNTSEDAAIKEMVVKSQTLQESCKIVVEDVIILQLSEALAIAADDVDLKKPMNADVSVFDILSTMPLVKLAVKIVSTSKFVRADIAAAAQDELLDSDSRFSSIPSFFVSL